MEYLGFPPYQRTAIVWALFTTPLGIAGLIQAFFWWRRHIRAERLRRAADPKALPAKDPLQLIMLTLGAPVFVVAGLGILVWGSIDKYHFRANRIDDVSTLRITPISGKGSLPGSEPLAVIADREVILAGLKELRQCRGDVTLNHESFSEGYRLEFVHDTHGSSFTLIAYQRTNINPIKTGVAPSPASASDPDAYQCPNFVNWVIDAVKRTSPDRGSIS